MLESGMNNRKTVTEAPLKKTKVLKKADSLPKREEAKVEVKVEKEEEPQKEQVIEGKSNTGDEYYYIL
jgi:hypothetical protein